MENKRSGGPPVIDMSVDGTILLPPSRWSRLVSAWRAVPPGALPALLLTLACLASLAVVLFGLALLAVPVLIVLGVAALVVRGLSGPRFR